MHHLAVAMARLPLVEAEAGQHAVKDWLEPDNLREVFRKQPRFVCPDFVSLRRTLLGTVVPALYFLRWVLPLAVSEAGKATCSLWAGLCMVSLASAAFRNPGVVPRAAAGTLPAHLPARFVTVNGVQVTQRWCTTCRVYRPLRAKHCAHCDRCVFRFDHHCTLLGNCVGLGNYRSFLALVLTCTLFFGQSAMIAQRVLRRSFHEVRDGASGGHDEVLRRLFLANGAKLLYTIYALAMCLAFAVLLLYHVVIISCNLTTNEHVRDYYLARNPFDLECGANLRQTLCAPYGRSPHAGQSDKLESLAG